MRRFSDGPRQTLDRLDGERQSDDAPVGGRRRERGRFGPHHEVTSSKTTIASTAINDTVDRVILALFQAVPRRQGF